MVSKAFKNDAFSYTHTFRNIGIVLQLQKLFKIDYYSSAYNLDTFSINIRRDPAEYEKYLFSILTTNNTHIYSSNKAMTRIEKMEYISDFQNINGTVSFYQRKSGVLVISQIFGLPKGTKIACGVIESK